VRPPSTLVDFIPASRTSIDSSVVQGTTRVVKDGLNDVKNL
jgi:hypothetical protein